MFGVIYVYVDMVFGFYVALVFHRLVGCLSMVVWTPAILSVLYACVLYFCNCTCSAQLSMFHMERRSRNMLIIIISGCRGRHHTTGPPRLLTGRRKGVNNNVRSGQ